jgi:hypothetical protein
MPYVGARAPEALDVNIATVGGFDMTTVTSVEIVTKSPSGAILGWGWTFGSATATEIHLLHTFASDGSDAPSEGRYVIIGWLVSATTRRRIKSIGITFNKYG